MGFTGPSIARGTGRALTVGGSTIATRSTLWPAAISKRAASNATRAPLHWPPSRKGPLACLSKISGRRSAAISSIDGGIGSENLGHPLHTQVAADETPIEEVQGRPIATGMELEERRRRRPHLHGDFCGKL